MMVKLTNSINKTIFCLNTNLVLVVEREAGNPLLTRVITSLNSKDGMVAYSIMESPEEVADLIAKALGKEAMPSPRPEAAIVS